jgi:hypothetical protein
MVDKPRDERAQDGDQEPRVFGVQKGLKGWRFNRRGFIAAAAAAGAAAALGAGALQSTEVVAGTVQLLADSPDGAQPSVQPGQRFTKVWRFKNISPSAWADELELRLADADRFGASAVLQVPPAAPGEVVSVAMDLVAPEAPGVYEGKVTLYTAGQQAHMIYLPIVVSQPTSTSTPTPTSTPTLTPTPTPTATPCSCHGVCSCNGVCSCVGNCTCDTVCTCHSVCSCVGQHYWHPN